MVCRRHLLSLPLLFSILVLVFSVNAIRPNYQRFLKLHVDPKRTIRSPHAYCQWVMKDHGLTSPACTRKNTFIHIKISHVKVICGVGGIHYNSTLADSQASYVITTCRHTGGSPPNRCKYSGQSERRRIRVGCYRGVPVKLRKILYTWP